VAFDFSKELLGELKTIARKNGWAELKKSYDSKVRDCDLQIEDLFM